jgi:uncharacterized damage-inducible protein DinB
MNRQALIAATESTRAQLNAALEGLTPEQMLSPGAAGDWSVKDILAHITAWEVELLTILGKVKRGQKPGKTQWTDAEVEAQNARWHAEYRDRALERVLDDYHGVHKQILRLVAGLTEAELAAPVTWWRSRPLYDFFMRYATAHEAEHLLELQSWRKQQTRASNGAR